MLDDSYANGILTDTDIKRALNVLFSHNADAARAKYCTYEIVLDRGSALIDHAPGGEIHKRDRPNDDGKIVVAPGETVIVFSRENFTLPQNVYARVNTVGQIFMAGFSAENTYIDPGYRGKVSITVINNTNRVLSMQEGAPLARVEFVRLTKAPERIHPGSGGVRRTMVVPSIDEKCTEPYLTVSLDELMQEVERLISTDILQKKSVRTDIALTRSYNEIAGKLTTFQGLIDALRTTVEAQNKVLRRSSILAAFALATASALWLDKFGVTEWVAKALTPFGDDTKPTYWLNIAVNIACSIIATPLYLYLLSLYQRVRS